MVSGDQETASLCVASAAAVDFEYLGGVARQERSAGVSCLDPTVQVRKASQKRANVLESL